MTNKKTKKSKKNKIYSFREYPEYDKIFINTLGTDVNTSCHRMVLDIAVMDHDDIFDTDIFLYKERIQRIKDNIKEVIENKEIACERVQRLNESENKLKDELKRIEKEMNEYITNKKKYKETSIKTFIDKMLLQYIHNDCEFNELVVYELLLMFEDEYNKELIIENTIRFLDMNTNKILFIKDETSNDEKEFEIELDVKTINQIKNGLYDLMNEKNKNSFF